MSHVQCPPNSELLDSLAVGRVMASRIGDVMARPTSKRYTAYRTLLGRQIAGYGEIDPNDQYRERALVPAALAAYEARHGVELAQGLFYTHREYGFIGCAPDAVESNLIGLTAHIRQTEDTYERAIADSMNAKYTRVAQASMAVTGVSAWIHLDYFEDRGERKRRLFETLFERNPLADELLNRLAWFYCSAVQMVA